MGSVRVGGSTVLKVCVIAFDLQVANHPVPIVLEPTGLKLIGVDEVMMPRFGVPDDKPLVYGLLFRRSLGDGLHPDNPQVTLVRAPLYFSRF
jgi:hypothetical protein